MKSIVEVVAHREAFAERGFRESGALGTFLLYARLRSLWNAPKRYGMERVAMVQGFHA